MRDDAETKRRLEWVSTLLAGFGASGGSPVAAARAYMLAIDDTSTGALQAAVERFLKGQVPNRNNAFAPSAAELSVECRLQERAIAHLGRRTSFKAIGPDSAHPELPLEQRKIMSKRLADLASELWCGTQDGRAK